MLKSQFSKQVFVFAGLLLAQVGLQGQSSDAWLEDFWLISDTVAYTLEENGMELMDQRHLAFPASSEELLAEIRFIPNGDRKIKTAYWIPSRDIEEFDPPTWIEDSLLRSRVKFLNIQPGSPISLILHMESEDDSYINKELRLYPYSIPHLEIKQLAAELFVDEEIELDLQGSDLQYIQSNEDWVAAEHVSYRIAVNGNKASIRFKGESSGQVNLRLPIFSNHRFPVETDSSSSLLDSLEVSLNVRPSRLRFVNPSVERVFFNVGSSSSTEIELEYVRGIELRKVYRIENQQRGSGRLIAELIPKSIIGQKMLCDVIPYSFHNRKDGYLYVKDQGKALFVTNLTMAAFPKIERVKLLREGGDWTENLRVYPGESFELRLEGSGLTYADIQFEGCETVPDTLRRSDQTAFYRVSVPDDISRRRISLFLNKIIKPYELIVQEYQRPAPLSFINIDYGGNDIPVTDEVFSKPVLVRTTIQDVILSFDREAIDTPDRFYGKQILDVQIKVFDAQNKLLDVQERQQLTLTPGETSERAVFYRRNGSFTGDLNLNDLLIRKTYDLNAFSRIEILISHSPSRYEDIGESRKINLIVSRERSFDIQISFPAGLLVKEFGEPGVGQLSGISTSAIAQFSFYDEEKVGQLKPYKIGVGFVAINAFNFSDSPDIQRDVGLVVLGSLEPVRRSTRVSFPLYLGFGYLIDANTAFAILGPGINVRF